LAIQIGSSIPSMALASDITALVFVYGVYKFGRRLKKTNDESKALK
jgi:hypothetical protein